MRHRGRTWVLALALGGGATRLEAQHLRDRVNDLFTFGQCGKPLCLDGSVNAANGHGEHFLPAAASSNAAVIDFLTSAVGNAAGSIPLSASSSGQTFKFVGGLPVKTSASSGPIFGERAQTLGRSRFLVGASMIGLRFQTIRGTPLDNLELHFTHQDVGEPGLGDSPLENDIFELRLSLAMSLLVSTFFVTYGVSDNLDLSLAVPVVHTWLEGRSTAQIYPFGPTAVHFFSGTPTNPVLRASAATFGSATGIGDIALRAKANLLSRDRIALALMGDARLPTGDEQDLLGAGNLTVRGLAVASGRFGAFEPHLNLGYLLWTGSGRNDALLATAGFDQALNDWTTLAVDLFSEWELGETRPHLPGPVTLQLPFVRLVQPTNIPDRKDHRATGSLGFKFRPPPRAAPTIVTSAAVPLRQGGLQPYVFWTLGLEFNF